MNLYHHNIGGQSYQSGTGTGFGGFEFRNSDPFAEFFRTHMGGGGESINIVMYTL